MKYLGRSRQLNFISGLLETEEECTVIDVQPSTLTYLLRTDDIEGLKLIFFFGIVVNITLIVTPKYCNT